MSTEEVAPSDEDGIFYEVTWHVVTGACPDCLKLNGQTWTFPRLAGTLLHPDFGAVWDLDADMSLMHPPNCHCYLEITPYIDWEKNEVYKSLERVFTEVDMKMPSNIEEATRQVAGLRANLGEVRGELREIEYILYRTTSILNRMNLPPEVHQLIETLQKMILLLRMFHSAMMYLEMGTPFGWILGGLSGLSFATIIAGMGDPSQEVQGH